jgi:hypothetical protein
LTIAPRKKNYGARRKGPDAAWRSQLDALVCPLI